LSFTDQPGELLVDEDCVIIPGFGGFITHYQSALIEPNKNIILPPGKSISFNSKLSTNDGLLAQNVSRKTGLNYNDSIKAIQLKISSWEKELSKTKYLELEGLGSFLVNKEGNLLFEQFNETNFSNSSFGLSSVHASEIKRVGLTQRIERNLDQKKASPKIFNIIKISGAAAAIAVFILLAFQINKTNKNQSLNLGFNPVIKNQNIPSSNKRKEIQYSKANQNQKEFKQIAKVLTNEEVQHFKDLGHLKEPENLIRIKEIQAEKAIVDAKFKAIEQSSLIQTVAKTQLPLRYHVIAGCFGVESNATKMVEKLKNEGFSNAQLVGKSRSGLLRVSYGSYSKKLQALKALAKAKLSHNINAWLAKD
jgi:hypothetical protein